MGGSQMLMDGSGITEGKTLPSPSLVRTAQHFWGPPGCTCPGPVPSACWRQRGHPPPPLQQLPCGPCHQVVLCQGFPSKALIWESRWFYREGAQARSNLMDEGGLDHVSFCLGHLSLRVSRQGQLVLGVGAESRGSSRRLAWHTSQSGDSHVQGQALPGRWWAETEPAIPPVLLLGQLRLPSAGTQTFRQGWPPRADVLGLGGTTRRRRSCVHGSRPALLCRHGLLTLTLTLQAAGRPAYLP